jgi:ATP-dependent HslUV protease, peptidase subunit HslV
MAHDFAKQRAARNGQGKKSAPGPWLWLASGIVLGTLVSFLIYLTTVSPEPQPRPAEATEAATPKPAPRAKRTPAEPEKKPQFDFYEILPGGVSPGSQRPATDAAADAGLTATPAPSTAPALEQYRGTTILSVRRNGKVVIGGDGQVSMGNTVMKGNARKVRRLYNGRVLAGFAGGTADAFTLFELFEAQAGQALRQPGAGGGRTGQGLAHRPHAAAPRGPAGGRRPRRLADHLRQRRRHRAGGRLIAIGSGGPFAQSAARALIENTDLEAREIVDKALGIAADICIYTNTTSPSRNSTPPPGECNHRRYPMSNMTPREIVQELDKHIVGQPTPSAPSRSRCATAGAACSSPDAAQRDHAEEHPDDRPDRRGQDRDRPPPGALAKAPVRQGRGHQVHRGRLCRPRRRIDHPRPCRRSR